MMQRNLIEKILQASEDRYRAVVEDQEELIRRFRPDGMLTFVNRAFGRYFGKTVEELMGIDFLQLIPQEDRAMVRCQIDSLSLSKPLAEVERRFIRPDGEVRWQHWVNRAIFDETGQIIEYQSVGRDITTQKKFEQKLRESEARYRAIVEAQTDLISRFKPDGTLTFVNDVFCQFYGQPESELLGKNFIALISPQDCEVKPFALERASTSVTESRYVRQDGSVRWLHYVNNAIYDEQGRIIEYQSVGRDITAQKEAEIKISEAREAIDRATRVTTLAVIGGGIAHEINQPLNSIRVLAETVKYLCQIDGIPQNSPILKNIDNISAQVDRIDNIVNHLRSLLRDNQNFEYVHCDLNDVIETSLAFVDNRLLSRKIAVKKELDPVLPPVSGSFIRFEEVVLNLLINAIQTLETTEKKRKEIVIRTWVDERVHLEIGDNGSGIDPKICHKIFEPFFTTQKSGNSMGLGLSIVQSIINSCNGSIRVNNGATGGAVIQISLPKGLSA
ncbi:MAG TPA: PAS domain S-box protein [Patescibacteria group bacterium]|nr:PAS domain S-box protein [Patescibacteria group bacterium]